MCTHLQKRGSVYYFRRVIPVELQPLFDGKKQWMHSLGTKELAEGKRLARLAGTDTDGLIALAQQRIAAGEVSRPPTRHAASRALTEDLIAHMEAQSRIDEAHEEGQHRRKRHRQSLEERLKLSTAELSEDDLVVRDMVRDAEFRVTLANDQALAAKAALAETRAAKAELSAVEAAPLTPVSPVSGGMMLDEGVIAGWAKERNPRAKGVDTYRSTARWFYDRAGRIPVANITRANVQAFKAALLDEGTSAANIQMKLRRLRTLLQWAFENDHATSNAAAGITIRDNAAASNRRKEFDLVSLRSIFGSAVYSEGQRPRASRGEAAYWLPLLALFTGARLEEIGQLRPADVQLLGYPDADGIERSAWFIQITSDIAAGLKVKNAASERLVPVHPELQSLGFVQFVTDAAERGAVRLFDELRPNSYGRLTAKWGQWFSRYLRLTCKVTDKRMVFHSFRHTFKHYARHVEMIEGISRQIMGHSSSDVADDYGTGYSHHQLVEGMKAYRVPGLTLPAIAKVPE